MAFFKSKYPTESRKIIASNVRSNYPDLVPVIVENRFSSRRPFYKEIAPQLATIIDLLRAQPFRAYDSDVARLGLKAYVGDDVVPLHSTIGALYARYKDAEDGLLYVSVSPESEVHALKKEETRSTESASTPASTPAGATPSAPAEPARLAASEAVEVASEDKTRRLPDLDDKSRHGSDEAPPRPVAESNDLHGEQQQASAVETATGPADAVSDAPPTLSAAPPPADAATEATTPVEAPTTAWSSAQLASAAAAAAAPVTTAASDEPSAMDTSFSSDGAAEAAAERAAPPPAPTTPTSAGSAPTQRWTLDELNAMKVTDLKKHLKDLGLPQSGLKAELVARLAAKASV